MPTSQTGQARPGALPLDPAGDPRPQTPIHELQWIGVWGRGSPAGSRGRAPGLACPVWLVGAGPGDPDLLTRKACRLLADAQIVFHDALVSPEILALTSPTARLVSVGKRAGAHSRPQPVINRMLVEAARSGLRVVRLKGGDPTVFGRAAEEIAALHAAGLTVEICPGITTACAAAAAALASLTLRGTARAVTFVTAADCTGGEPEQDWAALATAHASLAVYMGKSVAPRIASRLLAAGCDPATPVLVAFDVSLPTQRLLHTRLDALGVTMLAADTAAPAILMIGAAFAPHAAIAPLQPAFA